MKVILWFVNKEGDDIVDFVVKNWDRPLPQHSDYIFYDNAKDEKETHGTVINLEWDIDENGLYCVTINIREE
jgi:hypothetical protein